MGSSTSKDVSHITKFDGTNFPLWKLGCWLLMEQHDLIAVVDGSRPLPAEVTHVSLNLMRYTHSISSISRL